MLDVKTAFRDFRRLKEILEVAFDKDLGFYIEKLGLKHHLLLSSLEKNKKCVELDDLSIKVKDVMDEIGGSFSKLGQFLSLRQDLIPKEYCEEFKKINDKGDVIDIKEVLKKELKGNINDVFSHFSEEPISSSSVSQIHKAKLLNGERVVVKVQKSKDKISVDIDLMYHLADLIHRHFKNLNYDLREIIGEFENYMKKEFDFLKEASNIDRFYKNFSGDVKIPKVYWDYTTKKVLVMGRIDGVPIDDEVGLSELRIDKNVVSMNISNFFAKQIFELGFFHANPCPENILVLPGNKISLLDYKLVGNLDGDLKNKLNEFLVKLVEKDIGGVVEYFITIGLGESNRNLENELSMLVGEYAGIDLEKIDLSYLFNQLIVLSTKYNFKLPVDFILLSNSIVTVENISEDLSLSLALKDKIKIEEKFDYKGFVSGYTDIVKNFKMPKFFNERKLKKTFDNDFKMLEKEMNKKDNKWIMVLILIVVSAFVLDIFGVGALAVLIGGLLVTTVVVSFVKNKRIRV